MKRLHISPRDCAMHGAVELACFGGWLVVFPPVTACGVRRYFHAYWSPNATPWHHGMRPLWRVPRPKFCACGEVACPIPAPPERPEG